MSCKKVLLPKENEEGILYWGSFSACDYYIVVRTKDKEILHTDNDGWFVNIVTGDSFQDAQEDWEIFAFDKPEEVRQWYKKNL